MKDKEEYLPVVAGVARLAAMLYFVWQTSIDLFMRLLGMLITIVILILYFYVARAFVSYVYERMPQTRLSGYGTGLFSIF